MSQRNALLSEPEIPEKLAPALLAATSDLHGDIEVSGTYKGDVYSIVTSPGKFSATMVILWP